MANGGYNLPVLAKKAMSPRRIVNNSKRDLRVTVKTYNNRRLRRLKKQPRVEQISQNRRGGDQKRGEIIRFE